MITHLCSHRISVHYRNEIIDLQSVDNIYNIR